MMGLDVRNELKIADIVFDFGLVSSAFSYVCV